VLDDHFVSWRGSRHKSHVFGCPSKTVLTNVRRVHVASGNDFAIKDGSEPSLRPRRIRVLVTVHIGPEPVLFIAGQILLQEIVCVHKRHRDVVGAMVLALVVLVSSSTKRILFC